MLVLGIETSTRQGGVAIIGEDRVLCETVLNVEVTHSERLLPAVDRALGEARITLEGLGGIEVSIGPGSFTGLRIGLSLPRAWRMPPGCLVACPTFRR
jgi:tRNA threonylcarbamoyladenosine biosynthesis protein TsaB